MKRKLSPFDAIAIGAAVIRSIARIRAGIEAAKDPDSPGGRKVTPGEALAAVVGGLLDATPAVYQRVTGEPLPDDFDILDAIEEHI